MFAPVNDRDWLRSVIDSLCHLWVTEDLAVRAELRRVTKMPLTEIWDDQGSITGERIRYLDESTVRELVRSGAVQFVVADPGLKLDWIPIEMRFEFWNAIERQLANR